VRDKQTAAQVVYRLKPEKVGLKENTPLIEYEKCFYNFISHCWAKNIYKDFKIFIRT
jgi:hypothetical protein